MPPKDHGRPRYKLDATMNTSPSLNHNNQNSHTPHVDGKVIQDDGAQISYAEYGSPSGQPVFFFYGSPGSRYQAGRLHDEAVTSNIRLICPDRPGNGFSTIRHSHTLLSYARDTEQLATTLGIDTFGILAYSAGTPFALACAYAIPPERLIQTDLIATLGPPGSVSLSWPHWVMSYALTYMPRVCQWLINWYINADKLNDEVYMGNLEAKLGKALTGGEGKDLTESERAVMMQGFLKDVKESLRQGPGPMVQELRMPFEEWGFDVEDIRGKMELWHGTKDRNCNVEYSRWIAARVKGAKITVYEGENHLLTFVRHKKEFLESFTQSDTDV